MNGIARWVPTHLTEVILTVCLAVAVSVTLTAIGRIVIGAFHQPQRRSSHREEPDEPLQRLIEQKEVVEDWLDGVGGVDVVDAVAAVQDLIRLLAEIVLPGASEAYSRAIRAGDELLQTYETLESFVAALDDVLEAEEPAWLHRRERGGDGVGGAG